MALNVAGTVTLLLLAWDGLAASVVPGDRNGNLDVFETVSASAGTLTLTGRSVSATEGASFTGTVATFTDTSANTGSYNTTVNWGDGSTSAGTVSGNAQTGFSLGAAHAYADEGSYPVTISVTNTQSGASSTATDTAG